MLERLCHTILAVADYLTYWRYYFSHPSTLDFVSMGLGIRARHRRCRTDWNAHLDRTKSFIERKLGHIRSSKRIAVLGAGRLLDFPLESETLKKHHIELFDYDPSLLKVWKRIQKNHPSICSLHCCDLTGALECWTRRLMELPDDSTVEAIALLLKELPREAPPKFDLRGFEVVISLNLLSQLGLYWSDRVIENLHQRKLIASLDENLPSEIESAVSITVAALEQGHISMLENSQVEHILIIHDSHYIFSRSATTLRQRESALKIEVSLNNHKLQGDEAWEWQIAREGTEGRDYDELHEVRAVSYASSN